MARCLQQCCCVCQRQHAYPLFLICTAVKELTSNHRQSGDTFWGDCLNTLRRGSGSDAIDGVYQVLKTRVSNLSGGDVSEVQFKDAMRLYAKNANVDSHSSLQLQSLVRAGAERLRLVAGHGQVGNSGQVSQERIAVNQIPKDNCGGLADVVEVSPKVTHSCLPQQYSCEMAIQHKCKLLLMSDSCLM